MSNLKFNNNEKIVFNNLLKPNFWKMLKNLKNFINKKLQI